jgi:glycerophosphoryl diester phosphodiesterase
MTRPSFPLVVGHRGACGLAPENTLVSLQRALADGADWVEFDLRFSRDGEPVLLHDATLDRTTDGTGPVADKDFAALRRHDAGSWFDSAFRSERIPTLGEALGLLAGRAGANIEIKDPGKSVAAGIGRVIEEVRSAGTARWMISSFHSVLVAEAVRQGAPTGLLVRRGTSRPAGRAERIGAGTLILSTRQAGPRRAASARRRSLAAWIYTVNERGEFERAARWGFDAVIGDRPDLLRLWRERL